MYEGEVFTYRSDRAPRPSARPVRPAPAPSDYGRTETHGDVERTARLEAGLHRLEETILELAGRLEQLTGRLEELQAARVKAVASPPALAEPAPVEAAPIKTTVTMLAPEPPPPAPQPDVKVSLYAGGATEAILGQVRVTSQD